MSRIGRLAPVAQIDARGSSWAPPLLLLPPPPSKLVALFLLSNLYHHHHHQRRHCHQNPFSSAYCSAYNCCWRSGMGGGGTSFLFFLAGLTVYTCVLRVHFADSRSGSEKKRRRSSCTLHPRPKNQPRAICQFFFASPPPSSLWLCVYR